VRRLAAAALLAMACAPNRAEPAASAPRVVVETTGGAKHVVRVEIARAPAEQQKGLMHRTHLDADAGMLFLFEASAVHSFWMMNTLIPLDMIFIDDEGRIVGIVERAEPRTTVGRSVGVPSRYVLEVNGGWSKEHGVAKGDRVRFENVPRF
jgi:uncharacterized membrane protein (UPF0127 family)